jgi:hypothetical protein
MGSYDYPVQQLSAGVIYVDGFWGCGLIAGSLYLFFPGIELGTIKQKIFAMTKLF